MAKAACTQQAFHGASECLQVFGGHGYVREWGIEQIVRDAVWRKELKHRVNEPGFVQPARTMSAIGG